MSELSAEEISHLAKLARLELSTEEQAAFSEQLPTIVDFVDQLTQITQLETETQDQPVELKTLREDAIGSDQLSVDQIEKLAPKFEQDQIVVPAVLESNDDV